MLKKIALLSCMAMLLGGCAQQEQVRSQPNQKEQPLATLAQKKKQLEPRPEQLIVQLQADTTLHSGDKSKVAAQAAQISKDYSAYQEKPRKAFIGVRARQTSVALWADSWAQKIERVGTFAYPVDARGQKLRGNLRITVEINHDGSILNATVDRSSGNEELDQAALRILRLAAPFVRLPLDLLDDTGKPATVLVITRTWDFGKDTDLPKTASEPVGLN